MTDIILWDIYEITAKKGKLTSNKVRGRIRKFALENNINLLVENTEKPPPRVRFAILSETDPTPIMEFVTHLFPDAEFEQKRTNMPNPVLSKLKVNKQERYDIETTL